jgi:broad specificity phosphatase PhoE
MSTRFILVRHGQTEWNRVERFRGRADIPLNSTGVEQAKRAAMRLADEPIATVYASPLTRTMQTAELIAAPHTLRVEPEPALLDIAYGAWQGWTPDEAAQRAPDLYRQWLRSPEQVRFPGGESLEDVRARAMCAIQGWAARHEGRTVVLVSHEMVGKVVMASMLGRALSDIHCIDQANGAINRFDYGADPLVRTVKEIGHLR